MNRNNRTGKSEMGECMSSMIPLKSFQSGLCEVCTVHVPTQSVALLVFDNFLLITYFMYNKMCSEFER